MDIIGCDFHPSFQQIAMLDTESGEVREVRLGHKEEGRLFYGSLRAEEVVIGVEACGYTQRFERMVGEMGYRLRVRDAAKIRAFTPPSYVENKKTAEENQRPSPLLLEPRKVTPQPQLRKLG